MGEVKLDQLNASGRLPSPSGVALKLIELTRREDASIHDISRVLQAAPVLSGEVLRFANSARFTGIRATASISEAVARLGIAAVRQTVLGISLLADFRHGECKSFDYGRFWSLSLGSAVAARAVAAATRAASPDECFTIGLLARIGRLALASLYPERYSQAIRDAAGDDERLRANERTQFGFCHRELTAAMLDGWRLPRVFIDAAVNGDGPAADQRRQTLTNLLGLALHIGELCVADPTSRQTLLAPLYRRGGLCSLNEGDLRELLAAVAAEWQEWCEVYKVPAQAMPGLGEMQAMLHSLASDGVEQAAETERHPFRILVVDDDGTTRTILRSMLIALGHEVLLATNGVEAMAVINEQAPEIVITDWMMPEMDGIALCRALREYDGGRHLYLIIVTGHGDDNRLVEAFEAGADDYLTKPLKRREFEARLRAALRIVQLHRRLRAESDEIKRFNADLVTANKALQDIATTDFLTGLPNRRHFFERLTQAMAAAKRSGRPVAVLLVDIDRFKRINDEHGHDRGDEVLRAVAEVLRNQLRAADSVARIGGEEFAVLSPETDEGEAVMLGERLRMALSTVPIAPGPGAGRITASIGVAVRNSSINEVDALMKNADLALYRAKNEGRNRVCLAKDPK
jgi:diguanylate cyclase (GGDEF)-like protein